MEGMSEQRYALWRTHLWSQVRGPYVFEAGVGTGKNMPVGCKYSIRLQLIENIGSRTATCTGST